MFRAVCVCLNPFDVIAVELARHLFFGALLILGDVPEVRGDIVANHRRQKPERQGTRSGAFWRPSEFALLDEPTLK